LVELPPNSQSSGVAVFTAPAQLLVDNGYDFRRSELVVRVACIPPVTIPVLAVWRAAYIASLPGRVMSQEIKWIAKKGGKHVGGEEQHPTRGIELEQAMSGKENTDEQCE
jgi:hypothetical protein